MYNKDKELNMLIKTDDGIRLGYIHTSVNGVRDGYCHSTMYNKEINEDVLNKSQTILETRKLLGESNTILEKERTFRLLVNKALNLFNVNETVECLPDTFLVSNINEAVDILKSNDENFVLFQTD